MDEEIREEIHADGDRRGGRQGRQVAGVAPGMFGRAVGCVGASCLAGRVASSFFCCYMAQA